MKSLVVANWKMNPGTWKEAKKLFEETKRMSALLKVSVIVAPPAIFLRDIGGLRGGKIGLSAQNVHFEQSGSFTGEMSVGQAKDAKVHYSLVGHAERRAMGETDDDVRKKVGALLSLDVIPILCIGEHVRDDEGVHFTFVREQLLTALRDVPVQKIAKLIIAYEPVWAIGADEPMRPHDMHEMSIYIRKALVEKYGEAGHKPMILYGGAVDGGNVRAMLEHGGVKGFLVGRASIDAKRLAELLRAIKEA
jgi:triosephosphate isomerase